MVRSHLFLHFSQHIVLFIPLNLLSFESKMTCFLLSIKKDSQLLFCLTFLPLSIPLTTTFFFLGFLLTLEFLGVLMIYFLLTSSTVHSLSPLAITTLLHLQSILVFLKGLFLGPFYSHSTLLLLVIFYLIPVYSFIYMLMTHNFTFHSLPVNQLPACNTFFDS